MYFRCLFCTNIFFLSTCSTYWKNFLKIVLMCNFRTNVYYIYSTNYSSFIPDLSDLLFEEFNNSFVNTDCLILLFDRNVHKLNTHYF